MPYLVPLPPRQTEAVSAKRMPIGVKGIVALSAFQLAAAIGAAAMLTIATTREPASEAQAGMQRATFDFLHLPARPTQEQISYAVGYASFWVGLGALCAVLQLTFIFTRRWSRLVFTLIISGAGVLGQKSIPFAPAVMFVLAVRKPARIYLERVAEAPQAPAV